MKGKREPLDDGDKAAVKAFLGFMWAAFSLGVAFADRNAQWVSRLTASQEHNSVFGSALIISVGLPIALLVTVLVVAGLIALGIFLFDGARLTFRIVADDWRQFRAINNDELFEDES